MFDSVLVLEGAPSLRRTKSAPALAAIAGHAAIAALWVVAVAWQIDSVGDPVLHPAPFTDVLPIVFESPPATPQPPRVTPAAAPTARSPITPKQPPAAPSALAQSDVPALAPIDSAPLNSTSTVGVGTASDSEVGTGIVDGPGVGDAPAIDWNPGLVRPVVLLRIEPIYPRVAQVRRQNGVVLLRAEIAIDGTLRGLSVVQAQPAGMGFEESALSAVRQWRFRPATTRSGQPVAVLYQLQVTFTIR